MTCDECAPGKHCPQQYRGGDLVCHDCGLLYGGPAWMDATIPAEDWNAISPTGGHGGILCITCMARRLETVGRTDVPVLIGSGPLSHEPSYWWDAGFRAGRDRLAYEFHHGKLEDA